MKDPVDHAYAQEHDLYEAYLAGSLSEEDRSAFEAHYFDCEECLHQLELAEDFREGARDAAVAVAGAGLEREARPAAPFAQASAELGVFAALALLSRRRRIALGGALLVLLALPAVLLWRGIGPAGSAPGRPIFSTARSAELEARLGALEGKAREERQALASELARERKARAEAESRAGAGVRVPEINVPLFTLAAVRGEEDDREPVNRLSVPPGAASFVVSVKLAAVEFPSYRARLLDRSGREVWKAQGLKPDGRDTLSLLLPSPLLPPGRYALRLEGERAGGGTAEVGSYPFRIDRSP